MQFDVVSVFVAGSVAFLSPCILPLMPTYVALLTGGNGRFWPSALCFWAGFTLVFIAMGATASWLGQWFLTYQTYLQQGGAVFVFLMGLQMLGWLPMGRLQREWRPWLTGTVTGPFSAFLLGMAFTAGWTPCTGPVLAVVLAYAGSVGVWQYGVYLLFIYALGFALPFLLLGWLLTRYALRLQGWYRYLPYVQRFSGIILLVLAVLLGSGRLGPLLGNLL